MNRKLFAITTVMIIGFTTLNGEQIKPYVLASESQFELTETVNSVKNNLEQEGFTILGEYSPANDPTRRVIAVTHSELITAIKQTGGLTGFAAALRIACTSENGKTNITYTNPIYIGNAYFQNQYPLVEDIFKSIAVKLKVTFRNIGVAKLVPFGSEEGLSTKELRKYHYMFGMEYFDDVVELKTFDSYESAKTVVESNLNNSTGKSFPVYSIEIPNSNLKLYGVGLSGNTGEEHFLPIIDINIPKHTAFLPYEILLVDNKAIMLHGRYRIALSFPDLTMMTFSKIMSTPRDIEDLMRNVTVE